MRPRAMRTRWRHRALALLLAIATVGCAGSGTQRASSSAAACAPPKTVDERANGTAVRLCVGQILRVELHSTYWRDVASSQDAILLGGSTQALPTSPSACVAGAGCGTMVTSFHAVAAGTATVTAHRTTCGEALLCAPNQRTFALSVTVG